MERHTKDVQLLLFIPSNVLAPLRSHNNKSKREHFLVGWNLQGTSTDDTAVIVIAGAVTDVSVSSLERILTARGATILGKLTDKSFTRERDQDAFDGHSRDTWIELIGNGKNEPIVSTAKLSMELCVRTCAIQVIMFRTPNPVHMQYFSMEPMRLPLASSAEMLECSQRDEVQSTLQARLEQLVLLDPLRYADLQGQYEQGDAPGERLRSAVELTNECAYIMESIRPSADKHGPGIVSAVAMMLRPLIVASRPVLKGIKACLNLQIVQLTSISATAKQLDLRVGQMLLWPSLSRRLRRERLTSKVPISRLAPRYTALYNGVWLVANDLILGQAVGSWLCDNHKSLARICWRPLRAILVDSVLDTIAWLDSWPAGIKLNPQLSKFFCDTFCALTRVWDQALIKPLVADQGSRLSQVFYTTGMAARVCGLSMFLSLSIDIVKLCTLHLTMFYCLHRYIYVFFGSSLRSLFQLFRGKKRNPLRNMRTDDAMYELDQLLLGTLFFTLLVFLELTVVIYFLFFSLCRLAVVNTTVLLSVGLAMINHLPLFALMLRLKDPARLPAGIVLDKMDCRVKSVQSNLACNYFTLTNVPLTLSDIFRGYGNHLDQARDLPMKLFHGLFGRRF